MELFQLYDSDSEHDNAGEGNQMIEKKLKIQRDFPLLLNLPPSVVTGICPQSVQNIKLCMENSLDLTNSLRSNKLFQNPCILTKAVIELGIDEVGSNYPQELFHPHGYEEGDFEDRVKSRYSDHVRTMPEAAFKKKKTRWDSVS